MKKTILVPPNGGYGWVIVFASALNNFFVIPLLQNFGMIFQDTFKDLGFSATQTSFIINLNSAFGMLTGLFNGPLLKYLGYRKVAFIGASMTFSGVFLTSFSYTFTGFIISYGVIASLGLGLTIASYSLAINTYFQENRSKAISLSMTITGLGPIVMPQIINLLMEHHAIQGATMILSSICANSFVAATLLQPIKNHMKKIIVEVEDEAELPKIKEDDEMEDIADDEFVGGKITTTAKLPLFGRSVSQLDPNQYRRKDSYVSISYDIEGAEIFGADPALGGSVYSLQSLEQKGKQYCSHSKSKTKSKWWRSDSTINLQSCVDIFNEKPKSVKSNTSIYINNCEDLNDTNKQVNNHLSDKKTQKTRWKRFLLGVVSFFDLSLLKDPIYVNIMLGMSLAVFAEITFSVLTPFILHDFNLNTSEIATFLSFLGVADIIFRFLAPYLGDCLKQPPRIMYMLTLMALIASRFTLLITEENQYLLGVAMALGCAKGVRTVYMALVIPSYVHLSRLPSASGIQMMVNGICIIIGGPLIGVVRDMTGSYRWSVVIMNSVTFTTVLIWVAEFVLLQARGKKQQKINNDF